MEVRRNGYRITYGREGERKLRKASDSKTITTSWSATPSAAIAAARRRQRRRVSRQDLTGALPRPEDTMAGRSGYTKAERSRKLMGVRGAWLALHSTVPFIAVGLMELPERLGTEMATRKTWYRNGTTPDVLYLLLHLCPLPIDDLSYFSLHRSILYVFSTVTFIFVSL